MLKTRDIYLEACNKSSELHQMTDEERMQLQAHLRKMYLEIEKVCDRHGLVMMTAYGTVLGAVRHQGFIPWDDDLDLLMPRADYDKLINEYADELPSNYRIYAPNSKNGPIYRFAKLVDINTRFLGPGSVDSEKKGIFVDIFPMENTPTCLFRVKIRRLIACGLMVIASSVDEASSENTFYKNLMCGTRKGKVAYNTRRFIGKCFSFFNSSKWYDIFDKFVQYRKDTGFWSVPSGESGKWRYFQPFAKELFVPVKRMMFDDIEVNVPNEPIKHCEIEYGDWQQIPSENERWQHFIKEIRF